MNIQDWFPLGWTGLISLQSKELSRGFSNTTHSSEASILRCSAFFMAQLSHPYKTTGKTIAFIRTFVGKVISLLFNILSRLVIAFLPKNKGLLIYGSSIIWSDFVAQENSLSLFPLFPHLFTMKWWHRMPWSLFFECWVLSQLLHSPLLLFSRGSLVPLHFLQ